MTTFLNIDIEKPITTKFFLLHILFIFLWSLGIGIVVFRIDLTFSKLLPENLQWLIKAMPLAYFALVLLIMFVFKWYYNLAFLTYPFLLIFWFIPKQILSKGKIYLFSNYINSIVLFFKRFKRNIFKFTIFLIILLLLLITDIQAIKIMAVIAFSYFYFNYLIKYIRKSFSSPKLFGTDLEKFIDSIFQSTDKGMYIIKTIDEQKHGEKVSEEEARQVSLQKLSIISYLIGTFKENLVGFNGKKAFVISWIYQLVCFFILTLCYYTFVNYQLFKIDNQNFIVNGLPSIFDFFYYTIKTITFGNIDNIIPSSVVAKIFEVLSFLTLGIFLLIIVTSVVFSLRQDRLTENIKKASDLCIYQNNLIDEYIRTKYQTDIQTIINESANIRSSMESIKHVITKLF